MSRSTLCCFANCLSLALLFSNVGLGQTAAVGNSPTGKNAGVDDAGRPVETAPTPGLASTIEADRLFAFATEGPTAPCNAVGGMILSMVLRKAVPLP